MRQNHIDIHTYIHIYICVYVCIYMCVYICVYTYTMIHMILWYISPLFSSVFPYQIFPHVILAIHVFSPHCPSASKCSIISTILLNSFSIEISSWVLSASLCKVSNLGLLLTVLLGWLFFFTCWLYWSLFSSRRMVPFERVHGR